MKTAAERLGCTVDEALLMDETVYGVTATYLAGLRTRAEAYGCRVETLLLVDIHKRVQQGLALLDGE